MHIVCLEQGPLMNPLTYPSASMDWEQQAAGEMNTNPNVRSLPSDYPINEDESPIKIANFNAVGGGTILYAGHFPRFHPSDFRVNSLDGVADDWPIDYAALAPFYAENERMTGVAGAPETLHTRRITQPACRLCHLVNRVRCWRKGSISLAGTGGLRHCDCDRGI